MKVKRYSPECLQMWDDFVRNASNATFLHLRGYMDYHSDRFEDHSLIVSDDRGHTVALLAANADSSTLVSHGGLTYGGLLVEPRHLSTTLTLKIWDAVIDYLRCNGFDRLIYKPVPDIYCRYPAADDRYALWRLGAEKTGCQVSSTVDLSQPWLPNMAARQRLNRLSRQGVAPRCSDDYEEFFEMLSARLDQRYGVRPVHTLAEMRLLAGRFPDNIKLVAVYSPTDRSMMAGAIVYLTDKVAHCQYMATTDEGRRCGALALIARYLVEQESHRRSYVDFGTSCEQAGRFLNEGLVDQKYGLGGRPTLYECYELEIV